MNINNLIEKALNETFEEVDSMSGSQIVDDKWYYPKFGSDTLKKFIDILKGE